MRMGIRLLVLRSNDSKVTADFYTSLGFVFEYHKHGNSPMHYSVTIDKMVLEIYPLAKNQVKADDNLRLGFTIDDFDRTITGLRNAGVSFLSEPLQTHFGFMAIVVDPDGRKVELYKS